MDPETQPQKERKSIAEIQQVEVLDQDSAAKADQILNSKTKQNTDLNVLNAKWATNPDLKVSPNFNYQIGIDQSIYHLQEVIIWKVRKVVPF